MHFVLVSAANANDLKLNKSFYWCVPSRQQFLFARYKRKDELTATWFDVTSGLCQQRVMDKAGKLDSWKTVKRFQPVTAKSYAPLGDGWEFRPGQTDIMSIVDVYRLVEEQPKHTVFELSIFCHAWEGGPVLVNSDDDRSYKDAAGKRIWIRDEARDPDDKDGRARDFLPINRNLAKFREAFNPAAEFRIWGCNHTDRDVDLFKRLFRHKDYRRTGMKDEVALQLVLPAKYDTEYTSRGLPVTSGKLSCTFGDLRRYFAGELKSGYNATAASGAGVKVFGGAPGNGSDFGRTAEFPLIIVSTKGHNRGIIDFYREYLGVKFDAASFAEYPP